MGGLYESMELLLSLRHCRNVNPRKGNPRWNWQSLTVQREGKTRRHDRKVLAVEDWTWENSCFHSISRSFLPVFPWWFGTQNQTTIDRTGTAKDKLLMHSGHLCNRFWACFILLLLIFAIANQGQERVVFQVFLGVRQMSWQMSLLILDQATRLLRFGA